MGFIKQNYGIEQTSPLMTDKYHLTTTYGYWLEGRADNPAVFYMFGRKEATGAGYTVAAGLEGVIDIVERWQEHGFTAEDIDYLRHLKTTGGQRQFPDAFIDFLSQMAFRLKIDAAPEGAVFFPQEPVLRVEGPIAQVKILESVALCLFNGHSAYATQAARQTGVISKVLDNGSPTGAASIQGLRRGPGLGASIEASRSLGLGGYTTTSTGTAAKSFGQDFAGTMDHAWVMTHTHELSTVSLADLYLLQKNNQEASLKQALANDAFRSFAFAYPESGVFLVDTYDPVQGLENAIVVIKELRAMGMGQHYGVRFDSGDILAYSKIALRRFAEEGFVKGVKAGEVKAMDDAALLRQSANCTVFCVAADGIDEYTAQAMRAGGGFFKSWGIGTAGSHVPPLGLVYKASSVYMDVLGHGQAIASKDMTPVMKVAAHAPVKSSNPGRINARRFYDVNGKLSHVLIYDENLGLSKKGEMVNLRDFSNKVTFPFNDTGRDLLVPVFNASGENVYKAPAQKETYHGSGIYTTDLAALSGFVARELESLPDDVRAVSASRNEVLRARLLAAFDEAFSHGDEQLVVDMNYLQGDLPPQPARIAVYLDQNLYAQRMACEEKHLAQSHSHGVDAYKERFEQGKS